MSRLFAYMANDPARIACALHPIRAHLVVDAKGANIDSWGIGFYQGEVLLQRRPKAPADVLDFYAQVRELRTDALIAHARAGTVGKPKNENTHPFRFRSWLFAHHGTLPRFGEVKAELMSTVPDFLARNLRGDTDSEHLFHLFLAHLHESGRLDDSHVSTQIVQEALAKTFARVESLVGREQARAAECAVALTNGRVMLATRHGAPAYVCSVQSITDCPVCRETTPQAGRPPKRIDHEHLRAAIVIADCPTPPPPGAREVPDHAFVSVAHDLSTAFTPIYS